MDGNRKETVSQKDANNNEIKNNETQVEEPQVSEEKAKVSKNENHNIDVKDMKNIQTPRNEEDISKQPVEPATETKIQTKNIDIKQKQDNQQNQAVVRRSSSRLNYVSSDNIDQFLNESKNKIMKIKIALYKHMDQENMAVKKHGLVSDNHNQLDLQALAQYIQMMNEQSGYLPPPTELIKNCQDIVKCLARSSGDEERRWEMLRSIEEFLMRVVNTVHPDLRADITTAVLDKFYSYISDPQSDANAAIAIVLIVLDTSNTEQTLSAARWLVQQGENGPAGEGLRASLSCLYSWLAEYQNHTVLGDWIMAFIKAMEENERFDLLVEVSVDNIDRLFCALEKPAVLQQPIADVIFHVLASLRQSLEAFDKISIHVGRVLTTLASDSGQFSRQLLQNVVDMLTATVDHLVKKQRGENRVMFKDKYADVILCLERHMSSRGGELKKTTPWPARKKRTTIVSVNPPVRKVGLLNLGNTCYMNSVMQALLCTREFSTHVMTRMVNHPYWAIMAMLFGKLTHSVADKLNPDEFFEVIKPPFFTSNNQHDSSEFLGYLFELLQSFEHMSDENYDYSKPPVLSTANRWRAATQSYTSASNDNEPAASGSNRRSISPRPGGSGGGSSSNGGTKRAGTDQVAPLPRKRIRISIEQQIPRRDSYINSMFGGVQLTRVACAQCNSSSLSRDVFLDLQLAYPDKPFGWKFTVQGLLEFYCSTEELTGDNQYQCSDCGMLCDAKRSVIIETTPNYLIIVLKNFRFEPKQQVQSKLIHVMHYNHKITLPAIRAQVVHASYTLYAAVVHCGSTLDSGHYFTLAKDNGMWHKYNDAVVSPASEFDINEMEATSTPYVLFYRRNDIEEDTAPAIEDLPPKILECILAHNKHYVESVCEMHLGRP